MRILIATVQVPFVRGGAEVLAEGLRNALSVEGHETDVVAFPFKWYPPERILDHMLACRLFDLTEASGTGVDMVIGLKFPAYLLSHPNKVLWILHQHRGAYDLWDREVGDLINQPTGARVRSAIRWADEQLIPQAKAVFTIARNVSRRLKEYNNIDSEPLYNPPPEADLFYWEEAGDYFFLPSRLCALKRQDLVVKALAVTRQPVRVRFAGAPENAANLDSLKSLASELGVAHRVEWLGPINEDEKRRLYARALAVIFPPLDEDYGYVTLEGMLASKPIITCTDSGGPLEFVVDGQTGFITASTPQAIASAMDRLWEDPGLARALGQAGREHYYSMGITWPNVVRRLLS
ncbi:MAG TPA: glycosyltransferase family 4 protein [Blastocatellia bacterium]|jgi:glycosyltransferase involved in cell wall biosynthesis|nr:glycosyltransferase family 4 protein [Blastocatellia bacterium]